MYLSVSSIAILYLSVQHCIECICVCPALHFMYLSVSSIALDVSEFVQHCILGTEYVKHCLNVSECVKHCIACI